MKLVVRRVPDPDLEPCSSDPSRGGSSGALHLRDSRIHSDAGAVIWGQVRHPQQKKTFLEQPDTPRAPRLSNVPADWKPVIAGLLGMLAPVKLPAINFPDSLFKRSRLMY